MKRIIGTVLVTLILTLVPLSVSAQTDDGGMNIAPPTVEEIPQDSGYVDENNNAISTEDLNQRREEATDSNPLAIVVAVAVVAGVGFLVYKLVKKQR